MTSGEILAAATAIIAALVAYAGVRYTSRQTTAAAARREDLANKAVDAEAYKRARESYEAAITNYEREQHRLEARLNQVNTRIKELNLEIAKLEQDKRNQKYDLEATIEQLVEQREMFDAHLKDCVDRLAKLRKRLAEAGVDLSEIDPDLQEG
jgi:chromosome segregation ATPase